MIIPIKVTIEHRSEDPLEYSDNLGYHHLASSAPASYRVVARALDTADNTIRVYDFHSMIDQTQQPGYEIGVLSVVHPDRGDIDHMRELRDTIDKLLKEER